MKPRNNFERESDSIKSLIGTGLTMDALLRVLVNLVHIIFQEIERIYNALQPSTTGNVTVVVSSGSGGGGGTSTKTEYRSGTFSGSSGTVSVLFSSAMSSGGYRAYVFVRGTHDAVPMDENKLTKGASGFTFASTNSITGWYFCIIDS